MKFIKYLLICLCFITISCATKRPEGATEAEVLFKEAKELVSKSRFIQATEKLNTLRSQYPYSFYATHAELLQADILFSQENYAESAAAYILFRDFHPKYSEMGYVVFRISESFYRQLPETFDRDLSAGIEAIKYFNELTQSYAGTEYAKDALNRVNRIEDMLEKKEIYIADFYFKTKDFVAAKSRYEDILKSLKNNDERARIANRIEESEKKINLITN
ncbi:MAG: outer membrane protein assembly factor BamD [Bacteriovoracaceae bacterium]|nr:outer membrane protein assembly factor BamD [Bacteriovoracaceae bacterium]